VKFFIGHILRILFIILFILGCLSSFTQTKEELDNLKNELFLALPDTNKVNILNQLSNKTHNLDYQQSLDYAIQALDLADFLGFEKGKMEAYTNVAYGYHLLGKTVLAKKYLDKALDLAKDLDDKQQIVIIYNNYYLFYSKIELYDKASEYAYKALKLSEEAGYKAGIAALLINIANLYSDQGNGEKEKECLFRALDISKELNHKKKIALINHNLGVNLLDQDKIDEALDYFYKSSETYENLESYNSLVFLYSNIGLALKKKGNHDEALIYSRKSFEYAKKLNDSVLIGRTSYELASYFFDIGNIDSAYFYAQKAYQIDTTIHNVFNTSEISYLLYQLKYKDKEYKQASDYLKVYASLRDSLMDKERKIKINTLEAQYSLNKLEKQLQLIGIKNRIFKLKSISLIVFIILVSVIILQRLNRKRIKNIKDKEIYALKLSKTEAILKQKEAELKSFTLTIVEKNKQIRKLQNEITKDERFNNKNIHIINQKKEKLRNLRILTEDDWLRFKSIFTEVHPRFLDKLNQLNPRLSEGDKRQLMLIKLGFSISQSAGILGVGYKAIQKARQRLAKKFDIESSRDLLDLVKKIEETS